MDTKRVFHAVSERMLADFKALGQIRHAGSKGTAREQLLKNFLAEGRLPQKYAIGSGEVVGRAGETSNQSDVIVYDRMNGISLLFDESSQVYPIDCVYGVIEVKSALSKSELIDSLDKIATLKAMAPGGGVTQSIGGFTSVSPRPTPFGMVFAYGLAGNSLRSLGENLREWEAKHPPAHWPNYVCVLGEGALVHYANGRAAQALHSDDLAKGGWSMALQHEEESLFQFYCALHDLCARMQLGPVELRRYYEPARRIGRYVVDGLNALQTVDGGKPMQFTEAALDRIVAWCAARPVLTYKDVLIRQYGQVPAGLGPAELGQRVGLYDPDGLPGLAELGPDPFDQSGGTVRLKAKSLVNALSFRIDDALYVVPMDSLKEGDLEPVA